VTMALQAMDAEAATQQMKGMWDGIAATHSNFVQVCRLDLRLQHLNLDAVLG